MKMLLFTNLLGKELTPEINRMEAPSDELLGKLIAYVFRLGKS